MSEDGTLSRVDQDQVQTDTTPEDCAPTVTSDTESTSGTCGVQVLLRYYSHPASTEGEAFLVELVLENC